MLDGFRELFTLTEEPYGPLAQFLMIVTRSSVTGTPAHDPNLIAAAEVLGFDAILRFNIDDFRPHTKLEVLDPVAMHLDT